MNIYGEEIFKNDYTLAYLNDLVYNETPTTEYLNHFLSSDDENKIAFITSLISSKINGIVDNDILGLSDENLRRFKRIVTQEMQTPDDTIITKAKDKLRQILEDDNFSNWKVPELRKNVIKKLLAHLENN